MGNHYHLLLHCPVGGLSAGMKALSSIYTRRTNVRAGRDGPIFRGRFHSVLVQSDAQLMQVSRYIHRNPLDIGSTISHYRWSSYHCYLGLRPTPSWMRTDEILALFGERIPNYQDFVERDDPPAATEQGPAARSTVGEIDAAVATAALTIAPESSPAGMKPCIRATAIVYAAERAGLCVADLLRHFDIASAESWRVAVSRSRRLLAHDQSARELARRTAAILATGTSRHGWCLTPTETAPETTAA